MLLHEAIVTRMGRDALRLSERGGEPDPATPDPLKVIKPALV